MEKYRMICLCGKSASGKDYLLSQLKEAVDGNFIVSHTSRPKRDYEKEGIDYFFRDREYFHDNKDKFLEIAEFRGWYYGTSMDSLSKDKVNIGIFNPEGVRTILKNENINALVVHIDASDDIRYERSILREKDPDLEEIKRRAKTDEKDFKDIDEITDIRINTERNAVSNIVSFFKKGDMKNDKENY